MTTDTPPTVEQVAASSWQSWVEGNNATIIDVREPDEWALGTLPGAELISLFDLQARAATLDRSRPILFVCRSGSRSNHAATAFAAAGFHAANLAGGMLKLGPA